MSVARADLKRMLWWGERIAEDPKAVPDKQTEAAASRLFVSSQIDKPLGESFLSWCRRKLEEGA